MPQINMLTINKGRIKRKREIPADLMATSSNLSPRFPKVIIDESKTASGNANGTRVAETYPINFPMVKKSKPLPTISSIHNQKN